MRGQAICAALAWLWLPVALEQRSQAESLYWAILMKLRKLVQAMDDVAEDLQTFDESLSDTYFCNFSTIQSIPDSWAIKQVFPIMPIHRLDEPPTRHAVLGDTLSHPIAERRIATRTRVASDVLDCVVDVLKVDAVVLHSAAASMRIWCRR